MDEKSEVLQGTLGLMVLKTLHATERLHGCGIARHLEQVSGGVLDLNEGTVQTTLFRLNQQRWIAAKWGKDENNRRTRFYSITVQGARQLERETANWRQVAGLVERILSLESFGLKQCENSKSYGKALANGAGTVDATRNPPKR